MAAHDDTRYFQIGDHRIGVVEHYPGTFFHPRPAVREWVVPALCGRDVNRFPGHVHLTAPFVVTRDGPLRGWGRLDCEQSYLVDGCNVPADLIDALAAKVDIPLIVRDPGEDLPDCESLRGLTGAGA